MMDAILLASAILALATPTEAQLSTRQGDGDIIPSYFQGTWGQSLTACADDEGTGKIIIGRNRIQSYEWDARLMKIGIVHVEAAPGGGKSHQADLLLAESGEGRVGVGTYVISRVKDTLYLNGSRANKRLTDAEQYQKPNILCPVYAK